MQSYQCAQAGKIRGAVNACLEPLLLWFKAKEGIEKNQQ